MDMCFHHIYTLISVCIFLLCADKVNPQCNINQKNRHEEVFSWSRTVDFFWPNKTFEREAKRINRDRLGVPIGIKVYKKRIYMTLPRWSGNANIPANVVWITRPQTDCTKKILTTSPKLRFV